MDSISCGFGTDTVLADSIDVVSKDCENVTTTGAGAPAPPSRAAPVRLQSDGPRVIDRQGHTVARAQTRPEGAGDRARRRPPRRDRDGEGPQGRHRLTDGQEGRRNHRHRPVHQAARTKLRRQGKVTLSVAITFTPKAGAKAVRTLPATLR